MIRTVLLAALMLLSGCAKNVRYQMPAADVPVGGIQVRFSSAARNAVVTVNGRLVADGEHTERIDVSGVAAGEARVSVTAGGGAQTSVDETKTVMVRAGEQTTVSFSAPQASAATTVMSTLLILFSLATPFLWLAVL